MDPFPPAGAACVIESSEPPGKGKRNGLLHRAVPAVGRLRAARRGNRRRGKGRRRPPPSRRHGRPFRPQHHDRPPPGGGGQKICETPPRRAPHDRRAGEVPRGIRGRRSGRDHRARRGDAAPSARGGPRAGTGEGGGGIKADNLSVVVRAGANVIVSGSGIFGTKEYGKTISEMRKNIRKAVSAPARRERARGVRRGGAGRSRVGSG